MFATKIRPASFRPLMEELEDRRVRSVTVWTTDKLNIMYDGGGSARVRVEPASLGRIPGYRVTDLDTTRVTFIQARDVRTPGINFYADNPNCRRAQFINDAGLASDVYGSGGNDTLVGGSRTDVFRGGAGNDRFEGRGGDDIFLGGAGNDTYVFAGLGLGTDTVDDTQGRSTLDFAGAGWSITLDLNQHNTQTVMANGQGTHLRLTSNAVAPEVQGGAFNDFVRGDSLASNRLFGNGGNDTLKAGNADDTLMGGLGNDYLDGDNGNDFLDGSSGADVLHGGGGKDTIYGGIGTDTIFGGAGDDLLYGDGYGINPNADGSRDQVHGGSGKDTFKTAPYSVWVPGYWKTGPRGVRTWVPGHFEVTYEDFLNDLNLGEGDKVSLL